MKFLLAISLLCTHNFFPLPQEKPKADTVKKTIKPVKKKSSAALYPSVLIVNPF